MIPINDNNNASVAADMFEALPEWAQEEILELIRSMIAENEQKKTARVGKHSGGQ